jgi:hypothetical protein
MMPATHPEHNGLLMGAHNAEEKSAIIKGARNTGDYPSIGPNKRHNTVTSRLNSLH